MCDKGLSQTDDDGNEIVWTKWPSLKVKRVKIVSYDAEFLESQEYEVASTTQEISPKVAEYIMQRPIDWQEFARGLFGFVWPLTKSPERGTK